MTGIELDNGTGQDCSQLNLVKLLVITVARFTAVAGPINHPDVAAIFGPKPRGQSPPKLLLFLLYFLESYSLSGIVQNEREFDSST